MAVSAVTDFLSPFILFSVWRLNSWKTAPAVVAELSLLTIGFTFEKSGISRALNEMAY